MSVISVTLTLPTQYNPTSQTGKGKRRKLREAGRLFIGVAAGEVKGRLSFGQFGLTQATGTLTLSGAAGAVGGVINSVTITATASGGDVATAAAVAAAINASTNPLVQNIVRATSSGAVVTVTSIESGVTPNSITFTASGTGVTASAGGRLAGGTSQSFNL